MWQGMSLCVTLQYGPSEWIPSTLMPHPPRQAFLPSLSWPGRYCRMRINGQPCLANREKIHAAKGAK